MRPTSAAVVPQPPKYPVVGNVPVIDPDQPVQTMMKLARELGPLFRLDFPAHALLVASSHELVAELSDEARFDKLVHGPLKHIRDAAGAGLFTADTEDPRWGRAHRVLMPAFGPAAMRGYFDAMCDVADQLVTKWERQGPNVSHDVPDDMTRLTLDTIALCGFGYRFNSFYAKELHPFVDAMVRSLAEAGARTRRLPIHTKLLASVNPQYERDIAFMNEVVDAVIAERKAQGESGARRDLLGLMLDGKDPLTGERLDDVNIRHQIVTFLIAGHETTSGLLSFALYELMEHPHLVEAIQAEVDAVFGADPRHLPTFEEVKKLELVERVLKETLRKWPTAPAFALTPLQPTVLGGKVALEPGDEVLVLTPMLHRDESVWPEPERFDPDRFLPEAVQRRSPHAWKPFGNGQRACIGREFAMIEAKLVLGMLLHRFDVEGREDYRLKVKETLTLKPEGLTLKARRRTPAAIERAVIEEKPGAKESGAPAASAHGTKALVLFGSNTGTAEAIARRMAADASARGFAATVAPLDEYAGRLPKEGVVLVVSASYNGRPPDNARAFCSWADGLKAGDLEGVRYAVFGCGSREWAATWQAVPKRLDERFAAAGATRLSSRGEADASGDLQGDFDGWYAPLWPTVEKAVGVESAPVEATVRSRIEVTRLEGDQEPLAAVHGLASLEVLESRELVDMTSPLGRSKRHLALKLPAGMTYEVGDHLEVLPENPPAVVERAAKRFGLALSDRVLLRSTGSSSTLLPLGQGLVVRELLARHLELAAPASKRAVKRMAELTRCPPEKRRLEALANEPGAWEREIGAKRVSLLDLLELFPACELGFAEFLDLVPPLKTRRYSISSSPRRDSTVCTLTLSVLDAPALSGNGRYQGTCSTYLARQEQGTRILGAVRRPSLPFRPPEDPTMPVIFVGAGTGLAPFRGFLEDRAMRASSGERLGEALLFFGCDHPDVDFLYRDELLAFEKAGVVRVLPSFFKAPEDGVLFVQHRLWKERVKVAALLEAGARVYVCGDGARMAPAVRETLGRIEAERRGRLEAEGPALVAGLEEAGRYLADVFG